MVSTLVFPDQAESISATGSSKVPSGHNNVVCNFVASAFDHIDHFDNCIGIGIDQDGQLKAGVVIELKAPFDAYVTVFSLSPKVWTRQTIKGVFEYLFNHLGVSRITCETAKNNKRSRKIIKGLGFRHEGTKKKGLDGKRDAIVYGMTDDECRWITQPES